MPLRQSKVKFSGEPEETCQKHTFRETEANIKENNTICSNSASSDDNASINSACSGVKPKLRPISSLLEQYKLIDEKRKSFPRKNAQDNLFQEKSGQTEPSTMLSSAQKFISLAVDGALLTQLAQLQALQEKTNYFINTLLGQYDLSAVLQDNHQPYTVEEKLKRISIILAQQASQIIRLKHSLDETEKKNREIKDQKSYLEHSLKEIADLSNNLLSTSQKAVSQPYVSTFGAKSGR